MLPFIFLPFFTLLISLIKNKKINGYVTAIPIIFAILLCSLRTIDVGEDTYNYYMSFLNESNSEPLFWAIRVFIKNSGLSFNTFLFVVSILIYSPLYYVITKKSENPAFSFFIFITFSDFFFVNTFNTLRFSIASSFILLGIYFLDKGESKKSILAFITALGFHYSSIIVIPIIYLCKFIKKINITFAIIAILISICIGFLSSLYSDILNLAFTVLSNSDSDSVDKYLAYSTNDLDSGLSPVGQIFTYCLFSIVTWFCLFKKNKYKRHDEISLMLSVLFIGGLLANALMGVLLAYRIVVYLLLPIIIVIPNSIIKIKNWAKIPIWAFICMRVYIYCSGFLYDSPANILPYNTVL